ncbi:MAG: cell division protein ZapA [Minwuia sp.]|uniref:cell division protein ZapA n=1 Tax=Minwuia sp. TaxID=2493630 RepID=UPI003A8666C7
MPQVKVTVNGRDHLIGCGDGEEDRVRELAAYVDRRANELVDGGARVPDSRLMLMTALLIADDLATAYDELDSARGNMSTGADPRMDEIARRLEALADGLEDRTAQ